jgi:hypothetical protein
MCTYIVETTALTGAAKGEKGWMTIEAANVYYDHPYYAALDHSLNIDFVGAGGKERVAVELSAESARALIHKIEAALASGEAEHRRLAAEAETQTAS